MKSDNGQGIFSEFDTQTNSFLFAIKFQYFPHIQYSTGDIMVMGTILTGRDQC